MWLKNACRRLYLLKMNYLCTKIAPRSGMKSTLRTLTLLVISLFAAFTARPACAAEAVTDSLEVGLLTCAPGDEVYTLYGHTAIRVRNANTGEDYVFNYGMFDFRTPHFAWRFMMGRTDYFLGVERFDDFAEGYRRHGRSVTEQVLNLTGEEKLRLVQSLVRTASTDGWTYRYNFLYDNCTTRALEEIENCTSDTIDWPKQQVPSTFRGIIHEFAATESPWNSFGQDLILGEEVDHPIGREGEMFSPVYAMRYLAGATIRRDGTAEPLVKQTTLVVKAEAPASHRFPVSPLCAVGIVAAVVLGVMVWEGRRRRVCRLLDDAVMLLWGGAGCIVALLFFFSEHPAVGSNWLVIVLNPLPLLALPWKIWRNCRRRADYWFAASGVALVLLFIIAAVSPQHFPLELLLLALLLLIRSIVRLRYPLEKNPAEADRKRGTAGR